MNQKVRVRFAPSPTGPLHIGGVRTALYNYLFAKQNNGAFILRIEDTDRARTMPGAGQYIMDSLKWCRLFYDEGPDVGGDYGPYRQSERKEMYRQYAEGLVKKGFAYYAFDTEEELDNIRRKLKESKSEPFQYNAAARKTMRNSIALSGNEVDALFSAGVPYIIRIKIPEGGEIIFEDMIHGTVNVDTSNLDDKVLFKSDGMPTYHLANVVDDYLMKITHVIRGDEWLPSAPLHVLLYRYLGWEGVMPRFTHLPLILRPDGNGKLSKRDGDRLGFPVFPLQWNDPHTGEPSVGFRERGYFPEAVANFIALLGWNPGTEQELFSIDELVKSFSLEQVNKAGARFDPDKAKWFNRQYLKIKSDDELAAIILPVLKEKGIDKDLEYIKEVCRLMKERVVFIQDIISEGNYFFSPPSIVNFKSVEKKFNTTTLGIIAKICGNLVALENFIAPEIEKSIKEFIHNKNLSPGAVMPVLRVFLTGALNGPSVFEIISLLGKEDTEKRLGKGLEYAKEFLHK